MLPIQISSTKPVQECSGVADAGRWLVLFRYRDPASCAAERALDHGLSGRSTTSWELTRELSVLGSAGSSPTTAQARGCVTVFDGVLYNREMLNHDCSSLSTLTDTDADIILKAYLRWGQEVIHKVKGIFALIIWDGTRHQLLAVRDPLGVYPLFYADTGYELLLSTSTERLIKYPGISDAVNRVMLANHLCHRFPDAEETYFESIRRIPPGHVMRIGHGSRRVCRYWDPAPLGQPMDWVSREEMEQFCPLLDQAVDRCLMQGPSAIYLSGGLDSVAVASVALEQSRHHTLPVPWALSLAFPHPECDEKEIQKEVARTLGLPQVLVPYCDAAGSDGPLQAALAMCQDWPVPLLNVWLPAYQYLSQEAKRQGVKVIMSGSGGDEWLTVSPYVAADMIRDVDVRGLYRLWDSLRRSYRAPSSTLLRSLLWTYGAGPLLRDLVLGGVTRVAPDLVKARQRWYLWNGIPNWVAPDIALRKEMVQRAEQSLNYQRGDESYYLRDIRNNLDHPLLGMEKEEAFESGQRIGVRLLQPFWDVDLVDLLYRMPPHLLNNGGTSKGLVRASLARRFPQLGFAHQKKIAASNFFASLNLNEGSRVWQTVGGTPALASMGLVDGGGFASLITDTLANHQTQGAFRIWEVLSLEMWLRRRI